jgi:hypothetical protein
MTRRISERILGGLGCILDPMGARWLVGFLGAAAVSSCFYEVGDLETPDTVAAAQATSTSSGPATGTGASGGVAGQGGAQGAQAGGQGGAGASGGTAGSGGDAPSLLAGPFTACDANGFSGFCANPEVLVYLDEASVCGSNPSNKCIVNRCEPGNICDEFTDGTCTDHRCLPTPPPVDDDSRVFTCGTEDIAASGECHDNVALVPLSATRCELKDCTGLGGTCIAAPMAAATDCYER